MKRKIFLIILISIFGLMFSHVTFAKGKKVKQELDFTKKFRWTCQSGWQPGTYFHKNVIEWAERVESLSGRRIKIKVHSGGAIVKPTEIFDAVRTGAIECGHAWAGYWMASDMTICAISNSPSFNDNTGFMTYLMAGGGFDFWKEVRRGAVVTIFGGLMSHESGMWSNKELNTLEDFKGMKYRGPLHNNDMMHTLGAVSVWLPPGEIISALRTGVVDAAEFATPQIDHAIGFHEVAKYYYFPGIHQHVLALDLMINNEVWDSLPDDLKAIVRGAAHQQMVDSHTKNWMEDIEAMDKLKKYGTKIRKFNPEIQNYMLNTYVDHYENKYSQKSPLFKKVWEHQKKFLSRYLPYVDLQTTDWSDKKKFYKLIGAEKYEE